MMLMRREILERGMRLSIPVLVAILGLAGCGERGKQPEAVPGSAAEESVGADRGAGEDQEPSGGPGIRGYTLAYRSEAHGSLAGEPSQTVARGADGSAVTAVPYEGYHFAGWSDGSAENPRTDRAVEADVAVTAAFAVNRYTLTYSAGDHGAVQGESPQTVDHGADGSPVKAVPSGGYHFTGWSDGSTDNPRSDRAVGADLAVTAAFSRNRYTLAYAAGDYGTVEGESRQIVDHGADGSAVTAVASEGHHFAGWSDGSTENPRTDRNVTGDVAVRAAFARNRYALAYIAGEGGTIDGATSQTVLHGSAGSPVTAVPAYGYHFAGWSDGLPTPVRSDRDVTSPTSVTAAFARNAYTLTYSAGDHGSIDGPTPQTVLHGDAASPVTALPAPGYHFAGWSDGSTENPRTELGVTGDLAVTAVFEVNTYTVGGSVSGLVEGTEVVLDNRGADVLTVTADGRFAFATALLDAQAYAVAVRVQPTSPNQTCTVTRGAGAISGADVADVSVTCVRNTYTVGGTVFGLRQGDQLVLRNRGADDLVVAAEGSFTFPRALEDGTAYEVAIHRRRLSPKWFCVLDRASGVLEGRDVTDVDVACFAEAELEARAGIRKVGLSWNRDDFPGAVFNLCRAEEDLSAADFRRCPDLKRGTYQPKVGSPREVSGLANDVTHWFQVEVVHAGGRRTYSNVAEATPFGGLNDTGIDWCADDSSNRSAAGTRAEKAGACEGVAATHPGQDGHHGRDAGARARALPKAGSGSAGFDFTRVCMSGEAAGTGKCPPNPSLGTGPNNWACTLDNVTGLLWEVKTEGGLRGQGNTYGWFQPDGTANGGEPGVENGGACEGSGCDTRAFAAAVNALRLCGASDWRVPTRKELLSIVDNSRFDPAIDPSYFPNTASVHFWSSTPYPEQPNSAWHVYFHYGEAYPNQKANAHPVRLVRGRTVTFGRDNP